MSLVTSRNPLAAPIAATTIWVSSPDWCSTSRGSFGDVSPVAALVDSGRATWGFAIDPRQRADAPIAVVDAEHVGFLYVPHARKQAPSVPNRSLCIAQCLHRGGRRIRIENRIDSFDDVPGY